MLLDDFGAAMQFCRRSARCSSYILESIYFDACRRHVGRRTHITTSFNIGTDPSVIAYTSKHKDPKTFALYVDHDNSALCKSGLSIARALHKTKNNMMLNKTYVNRLRRRTFKI